MQFSPFAYINDKTEILCMSFPGYENGCINSASNLIAYKSFPLFFYVP